MELSVLFFFGICYAETRKNSQYLINARTETVREKTIISVSIPETPLFATD